MNKKMIVISLVVVSLLGAAGYGLWWLGMSQGMAMMSAPMSGDSSHDHSMEGEQTTSMSKADPSTWNIPQGEAATRRHMENGIKAGDIDPETGLKVLYYHDPMVPGRNFDSPGKSPFMDMMLVPEYAGSSAADSSSVQISPRVEQNLGMRTVVVQKSSLVPEVVVDGAVGWNERDRSIIQARATGFVEKLNVTATLDRVKKGQSLLTLYVPEWIAVQQEFLSLLTMQGSNLEPLIQAARQRMLQVGMTQAQIRLVERTGQLQTRVPIVAPRDGVVTELMVREGMTVLPGMTLMEINGLNPVWVEAYVPESQASFVQPGTRGKASSKAFPGQTFEGQVQTLLPQVSENSRTIRTRLALDNPDGLLLPGMFVNVRLAGKGIENQLTVPSEAVIYTGSRAVVMVAEGEGRFTPTEIEAGQEMQGQVEVLAGLKEGQQVAVSGQFLLDSEATLKGLEARLLEKEDVYRTTVVVEDTEEPKFPMMTHPPIEELQWPAMTMQFEMSEQAQSQLEIKPGDEFDIEFKMQEGGVPMITRVLPNDSSGQGGQ